MQSKIRPAIVGFLPIFVLALLLGVFLSASLSNNYPLNGASIRAENLTQFVNPFIGTSPQAPFGAGDTFPGAAYPMGMVQWSPDTPSNPPGGYSYNDSQIKDLSLTHFSGRGCEVYQDFPFMPYVGNLLISPATDAPLYYSNFSHSSEIARPGYYKVHLDTPNVTAELSVSPHTGIGVFEYPASNLSTVIINAGSSINGNKNSSVNVSAQEYEVTGSSKSTVGCGPNNYTVYFAAQFDRPFASYGTWYGSIVTRGSNSSVGAHTGAFLVFNTVSNSFVRVKVGISYVSVANAEMNLFSEDANFNLQSVAQKADAAWNKVLNLIQVNGGTPDELATFYTALYHCFFHPNIFSDVNGQYIGFDGMVHTVQAGHAQYENIAGWDQYRTLIRLLAVIYPSATSDIAQSLVNDAQQGDGHLPRWEQANQNSHGMTGDSGDVEIAEAYVFGATNFDTKGALKAMTNGAPKVREGYGQYVKNGYVPADLGVASGSITLEYSNDDFAVAQFAKDLGNSSAYATFLNRSASWENLFNPSSGYVQSRFENGTWVPNFSPTSDYGFEEGDSAQYTWMVTFNVKGLFDFMGGNSTAVSRLDTFFTKLNAGAFSPYSFMGNEPTVEAPWEYDFAAAPSHTQQVVRYIENQLYFNSTKGLDGNDDGGEMSSWYVFAALGIYPEITGVGGFVVGSPLFSSATIYISGGHKLQINAAGASSSNQYVESLSLNGSPVSRLWLPWSTLENGATLSFVLGGSPSSWGSSPADAPPSFAP